MYLLTIAFFGGTYFPPVDRQGVVSFPKLLDHITMVWTVKRDLVDSSSESIMQSLLNITKTKNHAFVLSFESILHTVREIHESFDTQCGGFGKEPKFPMAPILSFIDTFIQIPPKYAERSIKDFTKLSNHVMSLTKKTKEIQDETLKVNIS